MNFSKLLHTHHLGGRWPSGTIIQKGHLIQLRKSRFLFECCHITSIIIIVITSHITRFQPSVNSRNHIVVALWFTPTLHTTPSNLLLLYMLVAAPPHSESQFLLIAESLWDKTEMCNYFKNYYIYSTCQNPAAHFLRTTLDGNKDARCSDSPHDRFIVVVGKCLLCGRWSLWKRRTNFSFFLLDFPRYNQALVFDARDLLFPNKSIPARCSVAVFWDKQGRQELQTRLEPTLFPSLSTHTQAVLPSRWRGRWSTSFEIGYSSVRLWSTRFSSPSTWGFFFLLGFHPI